MVAWGQKQGGKRGELGARDYQKAWRNFEGVIGMLIILIVLMLSQVHTHVKVYQTFYFKYVQLCQLQLNKAIKN